MVDYSLYLCSESSINKKYEIEECVRQAILGGVTIVQVREKAKTFKDFYNIAEKIKKVTDDFNIPLIINDNIEVALKLNASGVHIGQKDVSCSKARKILGNEKIIGVTVTTLRQAKKAIKQGANYLGVGAVYKSTTKMDATIVESEEMLKILNYSTIPIVVIGGINEKTIPNFKGKNISGYAMIRPILASNDITGKVRKLRKIIESNNI